MLRYLKGTANYGLCFRESTDEVTGFSDADCGNCKMDRKSYTGYAFVMNGAAVSGKDKDNKLSHFRQLRQSAWLCAEAAKESAYLEMMLRELKLPELDEFVVYCDNRRAKCLAENPVFHGRMKHIDVRHHFVRQAVEDGILLLKSIPTIEMPVDVFTKSLPKPQHCKFIESLGVKPTC